MNEHEKKTIKTFFQRNRQERYLSSSPNSKQRTKWLQKLNHTPGLNENYIQKTNRKTDIYQELKAKGAPGECFVISCSEELNLKTLPLTEALMQTEQLGWGTIISCIPGQLAYYHGELGEGKAILEKSS
ncbi:MAG: hypothetical protein OEL55_03200 [Desulfobulbaceae bacterium]|nr:hypothetical protein [Desulfobulbaceae bacterium]